MAKRKRLAPPSLLAASEGPGPAGAIASRRPGALAPIASVAGETSAAAALAELTDTLDGARRDGRLVVELDPATIDPDYLVRDRIVVDEDEMEALMESLSRRGQQTPIDVADLGGGRYGLISGWRRLEALRRLEQKGRAPAGGKVLALLRRPEDAGDAYLAMIEENEIRVGLSYYERARIALRAVENGIFATEREALRGLFHTASRAKRSKIGSFLTLVRSLDGVLRFPGEIGERSGLLLAREMKEDPDLGARLRAALEAEPAGDAAAELKRLTEAVRSAPRKKSEPAAAAAPAAVELVSLEDGSLRLSGPGVTETLKKDLSRWLSRRR